MTEQDNTPQEATGEPVMDALQSKVGTQKRKLDGRRFNGARIKAYQWKPGQSGNPKGMAKGTINLTNQLKRELREHPADAKAVCRGIIDQAIAGDMRAAQVLLDRVDGLLVKKVEITDATHMKRLGFQDPLEVVPLDEADEPRTLDMSAGDGSDECEQEPNGDGSE